MSEPTPPGRDAHDVIEDALMSPGRYKRHVELRYCAEYMVQFHSEAICRTQVRLGPWPEPAPGLSRKERRWLAAKWRPWADGVAIYPGVKVVVIEAKIIPKKYSTGLGENPNKGN